MNSEIVKTLKVMCNHEDPQDQKLLLLAELVETKFETLAPKFETLAKHQDTLQKSLDKTNEKLDKVTDLLEKIESEERACPVYSNRKDFEKISFIMRYPRLSFLMVLGLISLIAGLCSSTIFGALKFVFGV